MNTVCGLQHTPKIAYLFGLRGQIHYTPVVISKNFNKGGSRCNHAHIWAWPSCDHAHIFKDADDALFSLVLIKYNKQLEMSQLPYSSEHLIVTIHNTIGARSLHFEKQGQCKKFQGAEPPKWTVILIRGLRSPKSP